jgi:hypothetical protein
MNLSTKTKTKKKAGAVKKKGEGAVGVGGLGGANAAVVLVCIPDDVERLPYPPADRPIRVGVGCWQQRLKAREAEKRRLGLIPTADRADRAHKVFGTITNGQGQLTTGLLPAEQLGNDQAKPRRYPLSQMANVGGAGGRGARAGEGLGGGGGGGCGGVAIDSVFDETHRRAVALAGIPGVGVRENHYRHGGSVVESRSAALVQREELVRRAESNGDGKGKRAVFEKVLRR